MHPETRYARSSDVNIAYTVTGTGPFDLVFVPGFVSNVELDLGDPCGPPSSVAGRPGLAPVLEQHHDLVRRHLARYRGKEVDTAGDGFASFDGPARAICCGCAIAETSASWA